MIREDGSILFDKEKCENCRHMVEGWEADFDYNKIMAPYMNNYKNPENQEVYFKDGHLIFKFNKRLLKDPRKEKLKNFRNHGGTSNFYRKENKFVRHKLNRKFRQHIKKTQREEYVNIRPRDYRTYGWFTW